MQNAEPAAINEFKLVQSPLGSIYHSPGCTIFFGNARSDTSQLQSLFPGSQFHFVNQVHSNKVVRVNGIAHTNKNLKSYYYLDDNMKADAQYTTQSKLAIGVRTADCIPVLLYSPKDKVVAAVHAGWRGIENEVIVRTVIEMLSQGFLPQGLFAWIGPHIGPQNFEVGKDVGVQLQNAYKKVRTDQKATILLPHPHPEKDFVNLTTIAVYQLRIAGIPEKNIQVVPGNTFTDKAYLSYRRDKTENRQVSLICLK